MSLEENPVLHYITPETNRWNKLALEVTERIRDYRTAEDKSSLPQETIELGRLAKRMEAERRERKRRHFLESQRREGEIDSYVSTRTNRGNRLALEIAERLRREPTQ